MGNTTTRTFVQNKETKNTVRFSEVPVKGEDEIIGQLYIRKTAFEGKVPDEVEIQVSF
jgi:hypothetical protein